MLNKLIVLTLLVLSFNCYAGKHCRVIKDYVVVTGEPGASGDLVIRNIAFNQAIEWFIERGYEPFGSPSEGKKIIMQGMARYKMIDCEKLANEKRTTENRATKKR